MRARHGQALTEFLIVAIALVPLFLLMPVIAKYQDISHATQMASRYIAFDAFTRNDSASSGWKPESQLADEVRRRFFGNTDAPIKTNDAADDFDANQNPFWSDPRGDSLIKDIDNDVKVSFGFDNSSSHDDAFSSASDGLPFVLRNQLDLRARGIYTANVSVALANLPAGLAFYEPFDRIDLSIARGTSVLIDPWTAKNPQQVESKIAGNAAIFPVGSLSAVSPAVDAAVTLIDAPGHLLGPKLGKLDFWRDVVPQDRLDRGK